jgi:hypothetical protein
VAHRSGGTGALAKSAAVLNEEECMAFWKSVQEGVTRAAAEAEKQARITRLNLQLGEAQRVLRNKQLELAHVALELARDQKLSDPAMDPIIEAITEQETRLADLRDQLAELSPTVPQTTG